MAYIDRWLDRLTKLVAFMAQQPNESIDHSLQDDCNEYD